MRNPVIEGYIPTITWRPININPFFLKVIELRFKPVLNHLVQNTGMVAYQHGFLKNYGTQSHICEISEWVYNGKDIISVDCASAYNSISWEIVSEMLLNDSFHTCVQTGKVLYKAERKFINTLFKLQVVKFGDGEYFYPKSGLPQGAILSPCLFTLSLHYAARKADKMDKTTIHMDLLMKSGRVKAYADDIALKGTIMELISDFMLLKNILRCAKLEMSLAKTECFDQKLATTLGIKCSTSIRY